MTVRIQSLRRTAAVAALATLGLASLAQAADTTEQRVALACANAPQCARQPAVSPRHHAGRPGAETVVAKKAPRPAPAATPTVDYERDLWRHQSSS